MSFRIINFNNRAQWDSIVTSFQNYDIYYLSGYLSSFKTHGDGDPILVYYESENLRGICAFMLRDISSEPWATRLEKHRFYDVVTPYGYGGWLFDGNPSEAEVEIFWKNYCSFMKEQNITDAFTRWSPWLKNQESLRNYSNIIDLGKTIYIDTSSKETIYNNIKSKDRNTIRKAIRNGIEVKHSSDPKLLEEFRRIYNSTMDKDHALEYYYFKPEFYNSIAKDLKGHWELFYAVYKDKMIAASIMLFCNGRIHYHLSGSIMEFRNLNATNLILYETALYGAEHGYKIFHLGGGVGSQPDALFKFKKSFNKNDQEELQFSISKDCFDQEKYDMLVNIRKNNDPQFNENSSFFPVYRENEE